VVVKVYYTLNVHISPASQDIPVSSFPHKLRIHIKNLSVLNAIILLISNGQVNTACPEKPDK